MTDNKVTRRDFAKVSAATAFAILASDQRAKAATNSDTLRVGLLGCGGRGSGALQQMLLGNPNTKMIAIADVFPDRVNEKLARFEKNAKIGARVAVDDDHKFTGVDSYKKILETDIDILIHATTPYCRPQQVLAAVKAGKHVFTEKPAAVDPAGIRTFLKAADLADEQGLSIVTGLQRRHQQPYLETIEKIQNGAIGDITSMRAYWCGTLPFVYERRPEWESDLEYRLRNWYGVSWVCGDNIVEQHVHNLDVINWVKDAYPTSVFASGGRTWKPAEERFGDIYDHFSCDYEYADGTHMTSFSRHWKGAGGVFEEVIGTKGKANCRDMGEDGQDPYVQEHINLVKSITGEIPRRNEAHRTAYSTLTAIMGRMSAYTGKKVTWDEALNSDLNIVPDELSFEKKYPIGPVPAPGAHKV